MDILREIEVYKGLHILDQESVLDEVSSHFNYDENIKKEIIRLTTKVIQNGNQ